MNQTFDEWWEELTKLAEQEDYVLEDQEEYRQKYEEFYTPYDALMDIMSGNDCDFYDTGFGMEWDDSLTEEDPE